MLPPCAGRPAAWPNSSMPRGSEYARISWWCPDRAMTMVIRYSTNAGGPTMACPLTVAFCVPNITWSALNEAPASLRLAALAAHFALWLAADRPATLLAPILAEAELVAGQYPDDSAVTELLALIATAAELP